MKKRLVFIVFAVIASVLSIFLYFVAKKSDTFEGKGGLSRYFAPIDMRMKDSRFRIRGVVKPVSNIVIVAIDHKSIKEIGRWPWSREITGRLIENTAFYGAKVTALDIVFAEPQTVCSGSSPDNAMSASVAKAGNVVMGYFFRNEEQPIDPVALLQVESSKVKQIRVSPGVENIPLLSYSNMDANIPSLGRSALDFGFFNAMPDGDGLYRKALLLLLFNGEIYPSLALKVLSHHVGSDIMMEVKPWGVDNVQVGGLKIPVREDGTMALNFYGPAGSFRTVSASDIINRRLKPGELKDAMVFIGATEVGIYDIRPAPLDSTLPGVEIHATVAANALENRFLIYDGNTEIMEILCIILFPILLGIILAFVPGTFAGLIAFAGTSAVFATFNYLAFVSGLRDMTIVYPLIGMGITYLSSEAWRNLVVEKKGRQLKKAFSSYISPDLVKEIEKHPDKLVLGGELREISILFSDIRGFTTISEGLTSPELVKLLNEYLSPMTRIVLEEKGTLDKFIGDAVMAIFNAPLNLHDHPTRACTTAVRMIERLKVLNEDFTSRGMIAIDIGVGINTGQATVGNMGADIRFDYTAIGDSVNLASRLEGLNKYYGTHILVSEDTRNMVKDHSFMFREVDRVRVKGKHQPVVMYELMVSNTDILGRFQEGLEMYRSQRFVEAKAVFDELVQSVNDGPSQLYSKRSEEYLDNPPGKDWDGVYIAKDK